MPISSQLTQSGRELRDRIASACTNEILTSGAGPSIADGADPAVGMELLDNPPVREVLNDNSVEKLASIPNAPVYEWHSPTDVLIPLNSITTLHRYCGGGAYYTSGFSVAATIPARLPKNVPSPSEVPLM
ncbi:lipase family protein [Rhodococcus chondri]|uniref:Lipase family protein n=1 Tax=Rhodococcus chondri TaxID=3065941 RepID=A0ABU7JPC6_9NOCA|nr:lipase family protein [Rhodococcus sp. CC-R104]MEE2031883.1 lipase family protein [Rhodococcus sp. CC-R104]